ncbi:unnamed protein product, partial [Polarella glacialis]
HGLEGAQLARTLAGEAVARLLAGTWARRFSQRPPRLASWGKERLQACIAADEASLLKLEAGSSSSSSTAARDSSAAESLRLVRQLLYAGHLVKPEEQAASEARLQELLGARQGLELAQAVRSVAQR